MGIAVIAPTEHEVLVFLCQVLVLLTTARVLGQLFVRAGQPGVIGELLAGVLLGPSVFGRVLPSSSEWLFPDEAPQGAMLYGLAWIGLLLLLAATGFESDLRVVRQLGRPAVLVSLGSLLVPLAGGFALGFAVPGDLLGSEATTIGFAAFIAVALSISSLPVVASILADLGMVRRNVGQLILAVAVTNDVVGWILLGVVVGLAESGGVDALDLILTVAGVAVFVALILTVGQVGTDRVFRFVASGSQGASSAVVAVVALVLAAGAVTQWMGVEAVLGAFLAGLVIGRSYWRDERALRFVETLAYGVLAPLFFATAGLRIDLGVFTDPTVAIWSVAIIAAASLTKFVGAAGGAVVGGLPRREAVALGAGLNARGALEIVIASIGLSIGVLNDASYGAIVVMAICTSLAAPPLLRRALADWPGTPEEQRRLRAEEVQRQRFVLSERPPLLLSRGQAPSIAAAQLIELCWPSAAPVTLITTADDVDLTPVRNVLHTRKIRILDPGDALEADTVGEAAKGHGAIFVGLADTPDAPLVSPLVGSILADATSPVVLVRSERISGRPIPQAFARVLVPVTWSLNSRAALEVASAISAAIGSELLLAHIDATPPVYGNVLNRMVEVAEPLLRQASEVASDAGAGRVATVARTADSVPGEILRLSVEHEADAVILATTVIHAGDTGQLSPTAMQLLADCPATVIVVATPQGWAGRSI